MSKPSSDTHLRSCARTSVPSDGLVVSIDQPDQPKNGDRSAQLRVAVDDGVAVLTLDDPKRRNALSPGLVADIVANLDQLAGDDSVGCVVVTGAGSAFCAGADLSDLASAADDHEHAAAVLTSIYEGFLAFARFPKPTIAAVNGPAVGAGMNLALACDVRICSPAATFICRFLELGIHPGGGHTWMLQRIVGHERAVAMLTLGRQVRGEEAPTWGLALECVAAEQLVAAAVSLGQHAATLPPDLLTTTLQTMATTALIDQHAEAVQAELDPQIWSIGQPQFRAALDKMRQRVSSSTDTART